MKITFEFTGDCNLHCFFCDCEFGRNEFRKQGVHKFAMEEQLFSTMANVAFPQVTVVNPTVIELCRRRGEIDCGGLEFVLIRYGNFFQLVLPCPGGHVSVAIVSDADLMPVVDAVRRIV